MEKPKKNVAFLQKPEFRIFEKNLNPFFAIKIAFFGCHNKSISQNEECHTSLSSVFSPYPPGQIKGSAITVPGILVQLDGHQLLHAMKCSMGQEHQLIGVNAAIKWK